FQKEVAARIVAQPGSKAYGRLSILTQWRAKARIVMEIPPQAFTPPPKVNSAVVHIEKRDEMLFPADEAILTRVVAAAFGQRRKMLRASLKGLNPNIEAVLSDVGIKPTERAENISIEGFCALARAVKQAN
ncbi:MAG: 16S rRNA (adenine1518-N6/adenine1519-N6)-dimethyltransferase, partial [Planctomycetota bacterium]